MPQYPWHKERAVGKAPDQANRPRGCEVPPCSRKEWEQLAFLLKWEQRAANCMFALLIIAIVALLWAITYKPNWGPFPGIDGVTVTTGTVSLSGPKPQRWNVE